MPISDAQELVFQLLARANFNNFSGAEVAAQLKKNSALWRSAYFTSIGIEQDSSGAWVFNQSRQDLISLRELPSGQLNLDTLVILPAPEGKDALATLASGWGADIVQWINLAEAGRVMGGRRSVMEYAADPDRVILYVWWD